jgi:Glycosyltransferase family 87
VARLHPVFGAVAINSGHADLLIGLAILIGALSATRRRAGWIAGIVIGVAALIKITALLGLLGIVLWAWRARRRRLIGEALIGAGAVFVVGYAPFLANASRVLGNADHTVSQWSPWNGLADLILGHDAWRQVPNPLAFNQTLEVFFYLGAGLVAVLAVLVGWYASAAREPRPAAGVTAAAYPIGAAYSLPWYSNWALPCLTDPDPSPLAWIVWLQAAAALTALKLHDHPAGTVADAISRGLITDLLPVVWIIAFVVIGLHQARKQPSVLETTR